MLRVKKGLFQPQHVLLICTGISRKQHGCQGEVPVIIAQHSSACLPALVAPGFWKKSLLNIAPAFIILFTFVYFQATALVIITLKREGCRRGIS